MSEDDVKNEEISHKGTFLGGIFFGIMLCIFSAFGGFVAGPLPALISIAIVVLLLFIKGSNHFFGALLGFILGIPLILFTLFSVLK